MKTMPSKEMTIFKFIQRNPTESVLFAIAAGFLFINFGSLQSAMQRNAVMRQAVLENQEQVQSIQIDAQKRTELAEIANQRYDAGCEVILSLDRPGHYKALFEGTPVLDGVHAEKYRKNPLKAPPGAYLPAGMTVCDAHGNTAILVAEPNSDGVVYPVTRQMATTTDVDRIRQAMERVRARWSPGVK